MSQDYYIDIDDSNIREHQIFVDNLNQQIDFYLHLTDNIRTNLHVIFENDLNSLCLNQEHDVGFGKQQSSQIPTKQFAHGMHFHGPVGNVIVRDNDSSNTCIHSTPCVFTNHTCNAPKCWINANTVKKVKTINGNINVRHCVSKNAKTINGDINAGSIKGNAKSINGNINKSLSYPIKTDTSPVHLSHHVEEDYVQRQEITFYNQHHELHIYVDFMDNMDHQHPFYIRVNFGNQQNNNAIISVNSKKQSCRKNVKSLHTFPFDSISFLGSNSDSLNLTIETKNVDRINVQNEEIYCQHADIVKTINGNITVGNEILKNAKTVNGSIHVDIPEKH